MSPSGYDARRLAGAVRRQRVGELWRIVPSGFADAPLGTGPGANRFASRDAPYRLVYAASTVDTALCETLLRDRFGRGAARELGVAEIEARSIVRLSGGEHRFALLELRDGGPLRIGAPSAVIGDRRMRAGQTLGAALHALVPEADGIVYPSRLTGAACVAFFDTAVAALEVRSVEPLVTRPELIATLDGFGISLV